MTTYSIWGQAAPAGVTYAVATATFGTVFKLSQPAALTGIWYYSAPSDAALPTECGIWDVASKSLVPGTHVTSPSWSGARGSGWIKAAYNGAVTLDARADGYATTVLYSGNKGFNTVTFPVTSGIITAPVASVFGNTNAVFQASGTFAFPVTGSGGGNNWLTDVEVTAIPFTPSYTLHNQEIFGYSIQPDVVPFTLGVQFSVTTACALKGIWFLTPSGGTGVTLPGMCVVYNADTTAQVAGTLNTSPAWAGAPTGSGGWVKCPYTGAVTLLPGVHYYACVFNADLGAGQWFAAYGDYWDTGPGAPGITSGPLTAPNSAGALTAGQAPYNAATSLAFPNTSFTRSDWGVDVEVTFGIPAGLTATDGRQGILTASDGI
jgi:hypothetical protein